MNFNTVICPRCGHRLTVSANAPQRLVCPTCFTSIENAQGLAAGAAPRPVIPLERQVESDRQFSHAASVVVTGVILAGLVIAVLTQGFTPVNVLLMVVILLAAAAAWALSGFPLWKDIKPSQREVSDVRAATATAPTVEVGHAIDLRMIDYRVPRHFQPAERTNYAAAMGGFFLACGVCAAGFLLLAATVAGGRSPQGNIIYLVIVAAAVVSLPIIGRSVGRREGWKGFRPGIYIGLSLGMLALGPCGFCYLLTLG